MGFCSNCGAQMDDHALFCPICGQAAMQQNGFQQPNFQQPGFQQPDAFQQPNFQQTGFQQPDAFRQPNFQQQGFQQPDAFQQPNFQQPGAFQQPGTFRQQQDYQSPQSFQQPAFVVPGYQQTGADRKPEIYEIVLSVLFPIVGIILYFMHRNDKPTAASMLLKVALIAYGARFILGFFFGLLN